MGTGAGVQPLGGVWRQGINHNNTSYIHHPALLPTASLHTGGKDVNWRAASRVANQHPTRDLLDTSVLLLDNAVEIFCIGKCESAPRAQHWS
ncbi:MAG: hypothetical protein O7G88_16710 [bacterium]|nr:hypothetical protein [bacterium]